MLNLDLAKAEARRQLEIYHQPFAILLHRDKAGREYFTVIPEIGILPWDKVRGVVTRDGFREHCLA